MAELRDQAASTDSFSFAFEGENEIEAALLGRTLANLSYVVSKVVEDEPAKPEYHFKVKALKKGSFSIDLVFGLVLAAQTASVCNLQDAASLFGIIKGMFDIKAGLKGEKPKETKEDLLKGSIQVEAPDGSSIIAPLGSKIVISNPTVEKSISEIAENARLHNADGGFVLTRGDENVVYDKIVTQDIALQSHSTEKSSSDISVEKRLSLPIKQLDLLGNGAWVFRYGTRSISASIKDLEFLKKVHAGENSYKAGDSLDVSLEIETKLDKNNIPIGEIYTIQKVHGIVPASEQIKI